jgi:zinc/manganese transport system substrate-binding protein
MILRYMITILIFRAKSTLVPLLIALAALPLAGCGGDGESTAEITVVATTSIWADVASKVVGDAGTVDFVIPLGSDAHDYQPSPREVALMEAADLVVANGLDLEEGLSDVLESLEGDGANILELAPELTPVRFSGEGGHGHGEESDGNEADELDGLDPHVWFDPERVGEAARLIAGELATIDGSGNWLEMAESYASELMETDTEIANLLADIPAVNRLLVTNHDALGYFADRYDFEIVGVVIPGGSTLADPSSAELAALVETLLETDVPAIFAETSSPAQLAETVAAEAGNDVEVVELHTGSLGEPGSGADTLIGMLRTNATRIRDALT